MIIEAFGTRGIFYFVMGGVMMSMGWLDAAGIIHTQSTPFVVMLIGTVFAVLGMFE